MEKISYVKQRNAVQQGIMGCKSIQVFKRKCRYSHHVWRFFNGNDMGNNHPRVCLLLDVSARVCIGHQFILPD